MKRFTLSFILIIQLFIPLFAQVNDNIGDARNKELLNIYTKEYSLKAPLIKDKPARYGLAVFKASENSLFSNDEMEMYFEVESSYGEKTAKVGNPLYWYKIGLRNKTDDTIYVDKSMCLRVPNKGGVHIYYTENSCIYFDIKVNIDRYVIIPPHSESQLTKTKSLKRFKDFSSNIWHIIEMVENFTIFCAPYYQIGGNPSISPEFLDMSDRLFDWYIPRYGDMNIGEIRKYNEEQAPYNVSYFITYSHYKDYRNYKTLYANFFTSQIIGLDGKGEQGIGGGHKKELNVIWISGGKNWMSGNENNYPKIIIDGYNNQTIASPIGFKKYDKQKEDVSNSISNARNYYDEGNYEAAYKQYLLARNSGFLQDVEDVYKAAISSYKSGNKVSAYYFIVKGLTVYEFLDRDKYQDLALMYDECAQAVDIQNAENAEREARAQAMANALTTAINGLTTSIVNYSNTKRKNEQAAKLNALRSIAKFNNNAAKHKTSEVNDNDDDDDKDSGYEKECPKCGGEGSILIEKPHSKMGGALKVKKVHCDICDDDYDANEFDHKHETCPKCKGAKIITY